VSKCFTSAAEVYGELGHNMEFYAENAVINHWIISEIFDIRPHCCFENNKHFTLPGNGM
jgi:hypothetical protein